MEEEDCNSIQTAKTLSELAVITSQLLNDLYVEHECDSLRHGDWPNIEIDSDENELLLIHLNKYYKENPLCQITLKNIDLEWFNVEEPLTMEEHLKSSIVILDFFTYCCINCLHILPDLEDLGEKFPSSVIVIGIHSGKFTNERQTKNVSEAVKKFNIKHPVANDIECKLWTTLGISCWPTVVVIGPHAIPLFVLLGEGHRDDLFKLVEASISYFTNIGTLSFCNVSKKNGSPEDPPHDHFSRLIFRKLQDLHLPLLPSVYLPSRRKSLFYPGKIERYPKGLIISDSGNNRLILTDNDGNVTFVIGNGEIGRKDGSFEEAQFNNPQGVAYHPLDVIFVADTNNHIVRKIDLTSKFVETIAGTGKQGSDRVGGGYGTHQAISSPWDLCLVHSTDQFGSESSPNLLLIAMAGSHQLWGYFLRSGSMFKNSFYSEGTVVCLAGSGMEENRNTSYPLKAGFAQPSGVCSASSPIGEVVFIADSESSSIRQFSLIDGSVRKVVGGNINPKDLFSFGDKDGCDGVLLQHPLAVSCANSNSVYVADTYNHKIKLITRQMNKYWVQTILGHTTNTSGDSLYDKELYTLNEPSGLCFSSERNSLLIADTNNSCIKEYNLDTKRLKKIELNFDTFLRNTDTTDRSEGIHEDILELPSFDHDVCLKIVLILPTNAHATPAMKQKFNIILPEDSAISCLPSFGEFDHELQAELAITFYPKPTLQEHSLVFKSVLYLCTEGGMCLIKEVIRKVKFVTAKCIPDSKAEKLQIILEIKLKKYHPNKAQTSRNSIVWNDQTMSHFQNILRRRQKQSSLDRFLVKVKPGSTRKKRQKREKTPKCHIPEVLLEADPPSKQ